MGCEFKLARWMVVLFATVGVTSCGGGGMSFNEGKRGVADLVDATYEAELQDLSPRPFGRVAVPCRSAGGAGAATGEYVPTGALEFSIAETEDADRLVARVKAYWEQKGYRVQQVPGPALLAQTDGYQMSFDVTLKARRALLGATGPCAEPESEEARKAPPDFRSLKGP